MVRAASRNDSARHFLFGNFSSTNQLAHYLLIQPYSNSQNTGRKQPASLMQTSSNLIQEGKQFLLARAWGSYCTHTSEAEWTEAGDGMINPSPASSNLLPPVKNVSQTSETASLAGNKKLKHMRPWGNMPYLNYIIYPVPSQRDADVVNSSQSFLFCPSWWVMILTSRSHLTPFSFLVLFTHRPSCSFFPALLCLNPGSQCLSVSLTFYFFLPSTSRIFFFFDWARWFVLYLEYKIKKSFCVKSIFVPPCCIFYLYGGKTLQQMAQNKYLPLQSPVMCCPLYWHHGVNDSTPGLGGRSLPPCL